MTISYLKDMRLHRGTLAAFAACGLIIAASQGLAVRAQAGDAPADYVAPLDMTWSTYADFIEYPDFLPNAPGSRSFAARETTGMNSAPPDSRRQEAAASQQEDFPDDIYKFAP